MKTLLSIIGLLFAIAAILGGIYVTFGYCLYGGIMLIIQGATAAPVIGSDIAFGIIRIICATLAGTITFWVGVGISAIFFGASSAVRSKRRW